MTPLSLLAFASTLAGALGLAWLAGRLFRSTVITRTPLEPSEARSLGHVLRAMIVVYGLMAAVMHLGLDASVPFASLGSVSLSVAGVVTFLVWVALVFTGAAIVGRLMGTRWLASAVADEGLRYAIGRFAQYLVVVVGLLLALQNAGIGLGAFTVILGALSVGVGFGLQHIVNNFVSGLIVLVERPIEVGDWIDIDDTRGRVTQIGARSTTVQTRDNISIIVPNGDFITNKIVNWSHGSPLVRVHVPVGVDYDSDMELVRRTLMEVALANADVKKDPPPEVLLRAFGDWALDLELCVWIDVRTTRVPFLRSQMNFAILDAFRTARIEIPFPKNVQIISSSREQPRVAMVEGGQRAL